MKLPKTATFIEGEKMELECTVYGVPTPEVSWKFGKCWKILIIYVVWIINKLLFSENQTLLPSKNIKFLPNKKNVSNAILVLDSITMNDRGNFYCIGKNTADSEIVVSHASYVRIKGKRTYYNHWSFLEMFSILMFSNLFYTQIKWLHCGRFWEFALKWLSCVWLYSYMKRNVTRPNLKKVTLIRDQRRK